MTTSQQLIQTLANVLSTDLRRGNNSIAHFFLTTPTKGGWEGWLQAEYARAVYQAFPLADSDREKNYPNSAQRADLWFQPQRGAQMWVELKAQRSSVYANALQDFVGDVQKISQLDQQTRQTNVICAIAVLVLAGTNAGDLNTYRAHVPAGILQYFKNNNGAWSDVTGTIANERAGTLILATYRVA